MTEGGTRVPLPEGVPPRPPLPGDTQPTLPLPDGLVAPAAAAPTAPRMKRRVIGWVVGIVVAIAVLVGLWFAAEAIARDLVVKTIRQQVVANFQLSADQQLDVDVQGAVLPQLIAGKLSDVTVSAPDVTVREFTGTVTVHAEGIPTRGDGPMDAASAVVTLDEEQLRSLLAHMDGFPADTVTIDAPNLAVTIELNALFTKIPVGVHLGVTAHEGEIVLSPASLDLAGATISADQLRSQFGVLASLALRDWNVCIAEYLPAGLTLTGVAVEGDGVTAHFDLADDIIHDPALQQNGTCG